MDKRIIRQNSSKVRWVIGILAGVYFLYACILGATWLVTSRNDEKLSDLLGTVTYTQDNASAEITQLEEYAQGSFISDSARGRVYKALAELSYMTGDDMLYNKYAATALFYLEEVQDTDSVVYLTNKYMGRLYANGCYEAAEDLLDKLDDTYVISDFSLEMQAGYYLSRADLAQMLGSNEGDFVEEAQAAILLMEDGSEKLLSQAKYDLLTVRHCIMNDYWQEAERILSKYSETDSFGYEENQVYVICDFLIPYEEMSAKITLNKGQLEEAKLHMDKYFKLCEQYQFRAMELNLLQYANRQPVLSSSEEAETYDAMEKRILKQNLTEITGEYAQILLADMNNTKSNLAVDTKLKNQNQLYMIAAVLFLTVFLLGGLGIFLLFDYLERDTLTGLDNRKKYEKLRFECDKKKIPYGFLMIDIDDFKKVNDTLGHHKGDVVLSGIAGILSSYTGRGIDAFRYGGEEMCMTFLRVPEERTYEIAEEIRNKIENTKFVDERKITISGGVAMSQNGENVFVAADRKLYEAKGNGKNQIRM